MTQAFCAKKVTKKKVRKRDVKFEQIPQALKIQLLTT